MFFWQGRPFTLRVREGDFSQWGRLFTAWETFSETPAYNCPHCPHCPHSPTQPPGSSHHAPDACTNYPSPTTRCRIRSRRARPPLAWEFGQSERHYACTQSPSNRCKYDCRRTCDVVRFQRQDNVVYSVTVIERPSPPLDNV